MNFEPTSFRNLVELLHERALAHPDRVAVRFLEDGENVSQTLSYLELHRRAAAVAACLQSRVAPGERALLVYPSGPHYVSAFLGCLYAGVIAVPAYPPESLQPHHLQRLLAVIRDAQPRLVLTQSELVSSFETARLALPELSELAVLATETIDASESRYWRTPALAEGSVAFLQYTSGATSAPKGVIVGHDNLIANEWLIRNAFAIQDDDVVVSWLPLFHDMGLIGGLLQPIFSGLSVVLMAPQRFIERPLRWLTAISRYGGTVSGAPDFAYRLCVERARTALPPGLDLHSWRLAFSGAEPVRAATLRSFAERFREVGFDGGALYPCYGLAEATLLVAGGARGGGLSVRAFDRERLSGDEAVTNPAGQELVGCGWVRPPYELVVVDRETGLAAAPGRIGEIEVSGPSVSRGYFRNPEATGEALVERDGRIRLRTGDLGFVHEGQLFVTGRGKDLIIIRGHNVYPQDVEKSIEDRIELVRRGRVAAFSAEVAGQEGIGVAAEISRRVQKLIDPEATCAAISEAVARSHGEAASLVLLLNPGTLPLTSSGKLQRAACRRRWQKRSLDAFAVWEQGTIRVLPDSSSVSLESDSAR